MCGRYSLSAPPAQVIEHFGLDECLDFAPRYNIPPGTDIPVIRQSPEGGRALHLLRWGLVPHWAKDATIGAKLNNARGAGKQPYFISLASGETMAPIHDRMPVIIGPDDWQDWLAAPPERALALLTPCRDDLLQAWPVNRRINRTQDDDAEMIEALP